MLLVVVAFLAGAFFVAVLVAAFLAGAFLAAAVLVLVAVAFFAAGAFLAAAGLLSAVFGPASFTGPDVPVGDGEVSRVH